MAKIIKCKVENILGAQRVEFEPKGESVTIGGANGQGKSSSIWALVMALGGKANVPDRPVRNGAELGEVVVQLEEFDVYLQVKPDRETKLWVQSKDGNKFQRAQEMLDKLFGGLSFDPGAFRTLDQKKRVETLRQITGLDFTELDKERSDAYEARTEIGRELASLQARAAGSETFDGVPGEEISVVELSERLRAAQEHNRKRYDLEQDAKSAEAQIAQIANEQKKRMDQIRQIENEMAAAEGERLKIEESIKRMLNTLSSIEEVNCDKLHEELGRADEVNRKVRANKQAQELEAQIAHVTKKRDALTDRIESVDKSKRAQIAAAKMPIDGLAFEGEDVTFNGVPFKQLSESEQWEVSTAIGFALNQKGIVFMRNSGGLDKKSRQRVRERAAALGVQLFLEVVDDQEDVQILIEEGAVKENRLEHAGAQ